MTADLLRQLDAYGDQLEADIDHVPAVEITDAREATESTSTTRPVRRRWNPAFVRVAGSVAVLAVVVAGVTTVAGERVSDNFDSVAARLEGPALPAASATTGAPATTAAPAATFAPTTTTIVRNTTVAPEPDPGRTTPPAVQGRDIVFVGAVVVAVNDSSASADQVQRIAESFGGFVAASETSSRGESVVTIRVLPGSFQRVLDRIADLGIVRSERVTSDDVTEVIVDLESQIVTTVISVERLRVLLADAKQLATITRLENELLNREKELERLRGRLRTVESQVALATINVTLTESIGRPAINLATSRYSGSDGGFACPEAEGPRIRFDDDLTICLLVENTGDVPLTSIQLSGDGMSVLSSGLATLRGDLGQIDPGDSVLLTGQAVAERRLTTTFVVSATPLNDLGEPVPAREVQRSRRLSWDPREEPPPPEVEEPTTIATALEDGWSVFTKIGGRVLRSIAFMLPFIAVAAIAGGLLWWRRRRYWSAPERSMDAEAVDEPIAPDSN